MPQSPTVATIVGSLRKDSVSRKLAKAFADVQPDLEFKFVGLGDLPLFNQDREADPPAEWVRFREEVAACDAVLFVTPEYNRSVPGVLKNALDIGSRPYGESVWNGKPGAVISVSPNAAGGFGANHHLRQSLVSLNVPLLSREVYVGNAFSLFDEAGVLNNDGTRAFLREQGQAFAAWIARILA